MFYATTGGHSCFPWMFSLLSCTCWQNLFCCHYWSHWLMMLWMVLHIQNCWKRKMWKSLEEFLIWLSKFLIELEKIREQMTSLILSRLQTCWPVAGEPLFELRARDFEPARTWVASLVQILVFYWARQKQQMSHLHPFLSLCCMWP